jgi:hypothetical protein
MSGFSKYGLHMGILVIILLWMKCPASFTAVAVSAHKLFPTLRSFYSNKKPDALFIRIGLGEKMGILYHDFFSIPMLLNSSELISEMSRFAPARATNTSKQIETARTNIGHTPFFIYLFNRVRVRKLYPLTVLIFDNIT